MSKPSLDHARDQDIEPNRPFPEAPSVDSTKVFVVGRSQINRVVVSKIVEKFGLRPVSLDPDAALAILHPPVPCTVILDGGSDNMDCNALMAPLGALRRSLGGPSVRVLLLSTRTLSEQDLAALPAVDAVVTKPITPERLISVLERMRG